MQASQLTDLPIFRRVPEPVLNDMMDKGQLLAMKTGDFLSRQGEGCETVSWILSGRVKISVAYDEDKENVIDLMSRGGLVGLTEVIDGTPYKVTTEAIEDTQVFQLSNEDFIALINANFDIMRALYANLSAEMRASVREINDIKLKNTAQRVGTYLLGMTDEIEGEVTIDLPVGKRLLAERIGMKQESLSRAFAKLKTVGVKVDRKHIHIKDVDELRDYCDDEILLEEE